MARKGVYAVIADFLASGVESVRIDALPTLCGITNAAVDAELSMLVRRGLVRRLGDRVQMSTVTTPDDEPRRDPTIKACIKCDQLLPLAMFGKTGNWLRRQCRICEAAAAKNPTRKRRRCEFCEREFLQPAAELRKTRCNPCELEFSNIPKFGRVQ